MSTARPRRPSPRVYRRRRAVALLVLVAAVVVVLLVILKPGSGGAATPAGSPQTGSPTPTSSGPADVAATPGATGSSTQPTGSATPATPSASVAPAASDGSAACTAGNITVTAVTDTNSYAAGATPQLSFSILNTGSTPCTINAGTSKQVYTITSGSETYWVSTDCQTDPSDTPAMLAPGVAVTSTPFAWNRVRSSPSTCGGTQTAVPAGGASYHLKVSVDGIASADTTQFILN